MNRLCAALALFAFGCDPGEIDAVVDDVCQAAGYRMPESGGLCEEPPPDRFDLAEFDECDPFRLDPAVRYLQRLSARLEGRPIETVGMATPVECAEVFDKLNRLAFEAYSMTTGCFPPEDENQ